MCNDRLPSGLSHGSLMLADSMSLAATLPDGLPQARPTASAAYPPNAALALPGEGSARYVADAPHGDGFFGARLSGAAGRARFAAMLGCTNSRIAPELAFDQNPGDLFVGRVAGNFVTTEGLGSLEFGAAALGHASCGAVNAMAPALWNGNTPPGYIADFGRPINLGIEPAAKQPGEDPEHRAMIGDIQYDVDRLKQAAPRFTSLALSAICRPGR